MAKNESRSMNADFNVGAVDGVYKTLTPDWSTNTSTEYPAHRAGELAEGTYGTIANRHDTLPLGNTNPKGTA